jgi:hypothetical protein
LILKNIKVYKDASEGKGARYHGDDWSWTHGFSIAVEAHFHQGDGILPNWHALQAFLSSMQNEERDPDAF